MLSVVRTAVVLVLLINFLQLPGGGKEYGGFIRLVTGLLMVCALAAGILKLSEDLFEENWSSWFGEEQSSLESFAQENTSFIPDSQDQTEEYGDIVVIEVPLVEEIPRIVMDKIQAGAEEEPR